MKHFLSISAMFLFFCGSAFCQTPGATGQRRSPFSAISSTQYSEHTELFAEFRPLLLNTPARFTAHLTQLGEVFKPYTDAEVTLTLAIDGKTAWEQTLKQPVAPGIYRFPVKSELTGTGNVTIALKMPTYSEKFYIDKVTVYADTASALAAQRKPANEDAVSVITYIKEKSWLETFATAAVVAVKGDIMVPQNAIITDNGVSYLFVQVDPEHFRKQRVEPGKSSGDKVIIRSGVSSGDRIVTRGVDKVK